MQKQEKIVSMFDNIAGTYDLTNRVLSLGIDKSWRRKACDKVYNLYGKNKIERIADVACGTGDMIGYWRSRAKIKHITLENVVGVDPSVGMLEVAKKKLPDTKFLNAPATAIPLEDESVDIISISYGIRNVVERDVALKEFHRVLKKGGLLAILEFTKSDKRGFSETIKDIYMNKLLPIVGGVISKNREAYTYLPNSIEDFLTTSKLTNELKENGLEPVFVKGFTLNISTLFIGKKV
jgi:demethylmenaquinone methyltransferase/2-methoxy-6-polyprenyl-1,4-benzoquinol methylase